MATRNRSFLASLLGKGKAPQGPMKATGWTVGRKLLMGFAVVALLIAVMAGISFTSMVMIQESFEKVAEDTLVELKALGEIRALALELQGETYAYVLSGEKYDLEEVEEAAEKLDTIVESYTSAEKELATEAEKKAELERSWRSRRSRWKLR